MASINDLLAQLLDQADLMRHWPCGPLMTEAAAEIERLLAELKSVRDTEIKLCEINLELTDEIARLRAVESAVKQYLAVNHWRHPLGCTSTIVPADSCDCGLVELELLVGVKHDRR